MSPKPWKISDEREEDPMMQWCIRDGGGVLIAVGMTKEDAMAACFAVNTAHDTEGMGR